MTRGPVAANEVRRGSPPPVSLEVWPLSESGPGKWAVLALLAAVPLLVGWVTRDTTLGVAAAVLVLAAGWRFFVPTAYEVDALGISERVLWMHRRIPWRAVAGVDIGRRGVLVIPDARCCPRLRGLYLPWGPQRDALLALFTYHLNVPAERQLETDFDIGAPHEPSPPTAPATNAPVAQPTAESANTEGPT